MRLLLTLLLLTGMAECSFGQTATTQQNLTYPATPAQTQAAVGNYAIASTVYGAQRLKTVKVLSFDAIEDKKKNELKEDCRILDRLINKALPNFNQNTLGVNVSHSASASMSYIAGKGYILTYHLPYVLSTSELEPKTTKTKKELSEWEKAKSELTLPTPWRYGAIGQLRTATNLESTLKSSQTLTPAKVQELKTSISKTLTNVKNMRSANGESVTVFLYGKTVNVGGKLTRNILAFEVGISSNVSEKDVRSRIYSEQATPVSGTTVNSAYYGGR